MPPSCRMVYILQSMTIHGVNVFFLIAKELQPLKKNARRPFEMPEAVSPKSLLQRFIVVTVVHRAQENPFDQFSSKSKTVLFQFGLLFYLADFPKFCDFQVRMRQPIFFQTKNQKRFLRPLIQKAKSPLRHFSGKNISLMSFYPINH